MRTVLRALGLALTALVAFSVLFPPLYAALATDEDDRPPLAEPPRQPPPGTYTVYVADWGYHTSIVVPQPDTGWRLGPPGRETAPWVEYAWGDRRFYRDSDYRPQAVFATLVLPTASVAYVAGRDRPPSVAAGARAVYARTVSAATLHALVVELERTIVHDASSDRRAPASAPVAGYAGRFYEAHGRYLWARDCNAWTVARLAAVGLARPAHGVVLTGQVAPRLVGFAPVGSAEIRALQIGRPVVP